MIFNKCRKYTVKPTIPRWACWFYAVCAPMFVTKSRKSIVKPKSPPYTKCDTSPTFGAQNQKTPGKNKNIKHQKQLGRWPNKTKKTKCWKLVMLKPSSSQNCVCFGVFGHLWVLVSGGGGRMCFGFVPHIFALTVYVRHASLKSGESFACCVWTFWCYHPVVPVFINKWRNCTVKPKSPPHKMRNIPNCCGTQPENTRRNQNKNKQKTKQKR